MDIVRVARKLTGDVHNREMRIVSFQYPAARVHLYGNLGTLTEQEEEKGSGLSTQVGHEIDDQIEDDGIDDFEGQITKHGSERLGRRMVESVTLMLFDDGSLSVECEDLLIIVRS